MLLTAFRSLLESLSAAVNGCLLSQLAGERFGEIEGAELCAPLLGIRVGIRHLPGVGTVCRFN